MNEDSEIGFGCGCLVILLIVAGLFGLAYATSSQQITATIERTVVDRGNTYFILLQDGHEKTEIFENEDSWVFLKFNSGDILMNLEVGRRYSFNIAGWRVPLFSWFRNIISYQELP